MGFCVCEGAILRCPFGNIQTALLVLPDKNVGCPMPVAVETDYIPFVNILPFGLCSNPANPEVAAATAAALGILTPMPCIPATCTPWTNSNPKVKAKGKAVLTSKSRLQCMWGGIIEISFSGQVSVLT